MTLYFRSRFVYNLAYMRLKNVPGCREKIEASKYAVLPEEDERGLFIEKDWSVKGHWAELFGNDNPIRLEIGMGKGAFLMEMARRNPDVNFVGVEKFSAVLVRAVEKQDEEKLPNVRLLRLDAEFIEWAFAPGEVEKIYLNFSDPWPKARYAKRRLTSRQYLARYEKMLSVGGVVEFKTDNNDLFEWSVEEAQEAGWRMLAITRDLHADPMLNEGNVMTEYETKFSAKGQKINKMIIAPNTESEAESMNTEALKNLKERRSVRTYDPNKQVPKELVELICEAGTYAPTAMNKMSPYIVVVQDKETIEYMSKLNAAVMGRDIDPFYGAPTVLVVLADKAVAGTYVYDGSLVMGNLMNAAHAVGVSSCWINRAKEVFDSPEGKALLAKWGLPETCEGIGNCILGFNTGADPEAKPRKEGYVIWA